MTWGSLTPPYRTDLITDHPFEPSPWPDVCGDGGRPDNWIQMCGYSRAEHADPGDGGSADERPA